MVEMDFTQGDRLGGGERKCKYHRILWPWIVILASLWMTAFGAFCGMLLSQ